MQAAYFLTRISKDSQNFVVKNCTEKQLYRDKNKAICLKLFKVIDRKISNAGLEII